MTAHNMSFGGDIIKVTQAVHDIIVYHSPWLWEFCDWHVVILSPLFLLIFNLRALVGGIFSCSSSVKVQ